MRTQSRQTLVGHLARSGLFSRHSEYLCTLGLGYLLDQPAPPSRSRPYAR